jgi:uncharacterized protein (DUF2249 family)/CRP-like cAMP-binding protein
MCSEVRSDPGGPGRATIVDVRATPVGARHPMIFERFDGLPADGTLVLVTDHEPRPLRAEFESTRAGRFAWRHVRLGESHWEATIRKIDPAANGPVETVRRSTAFVDASTDDVRDLAARARVAAVRRGRAIVEQGVRWPYVGIVASGSVTAMLIAPDGRELAMYELFAGETFGTIALVDDGVSPLRFVAREKETVVLLVPLDVVGAVMRRSVPVARAIDAMNSQLFRSVVRRFGAHVARPVAARVADALLAYASPQPGLAAALEPLPHMAQVELAAIAGTAKDMIYRAIGEFEEAGALARENGRIVRLDRAKLASFSETLKY